MVGSNSKTLGSILSRWLAIGVMASALAACGGGDSGTDGAAAAPATQSSTSNATASSSTSSGSASTGTASSSSNNQSVTSGSSTTTTTTTTPVTTPVTTPTNTNHAPVMAGSAATSVNVNTAYSFQPSASDADGNSLVFSVQNKPSWATFSVSTGKLSGTPTLANVGTYSNIIITVNDGTVVSTLPAFSIAVTQVSNGSATLSWEAPTQNIDGSALTTLAGYTILYGTNAQSLTQTVAINTVGMTDYVVQNLSPGTWYFVVKAVTTDGQESAGSNVATKTI